MTTIDYAKARELMVEQQVRPWDVLDPRVLDVLATLPREAFVSAEHRNLAYADLSLPLGHGEFAMKPVLEGRTLHSLELDPTDDVLEIGTGSGYLTACLGRLAREVTSLEIHADLADAARARLSEQSVENAQVVLADAYAWRSERRYNAICVTGAVAEIPQHFFDWLQPDGRLFVVRGRSPAMEAVLVRNEVNARRIQSLFETDLPYLVGAAPAPVFEF
ncbi:MULTISPECIES: protein-L-isoaspartate O-methyltransferase [unclassified Lysobacter]|uniref:protein-L-isoaspartate O-methyltransferase family protein n=1 Tax=unclassified Lysobacter TaxID=2635362 RepID=UPI0007021EC7|nr:MULTISPECIES: protein-L-isoaspartate O-methyltransferase [unclassified Lysobacter]KRA16138.1 protein-L-isoaspartate O-methyltransferase [Lysobacter sp. Root604]KRD31839.1 protein-L-isoaspartate O-methyltransferase [Lysobacter sp. Root916]KRD75708.1 protein-L-isoaspartate O-methyltransferase [Lysobacter sp. Root983]